MNEKRIEQVLEVERRAQEILDVAKHEAEQIPLEAEQEAREMVERARSEAQDEANQMIVRAQSQEETAEIVSAAEQKNRETEQKATQNLDKAVSFVIERIIGRA